MVLMILQSRNVNRQVWRVPIFNRERLSVIPSVGNHQNFHVGHSSRGGRVEDDGVIEFTMAASLPKVFDLYTLACRAYDPEDVGNNFAAAFDECFEGIQPNVILQRVRASDAYRWIGQFWETSVLNPFFWRVAWINPRGFSRVRARSPTTDVAVIEDCYWDFDSNVDTLEVPEYVAYSYHMGHVTFVDGSMVSVRRLYAREVISLLSELQEKFEVPGPIESCWFGDAYLPTLLVDGVPESQEHAEVRRRVVTREHSYALMRSYLSDPNWEQAILEDDDKRIADGEVG